jgi:sec-independent protein translocase protein TatA
MGSLSIWHWIIVIGVVLLLFGRGKISELMGDVAQGIKAFKKGMSEDEIQTAAPGGKPADAAKSTMTMPARPRRRARKPRTASKGRPPDRRFRAAAILRQHRGARPWTGFAPFVHDPEKWMPVFG